MLNVNYRVLICCTCHFQSGSLFFILASSVCKSFQCLISALTQGGKGDHLFRLTSVVLWGGRDTANKYRWRVGNAPGVWPTVGLSQLPGVCFRGLHCSGSGSAGAPSKAGPAFRALPRSKPLRLRFSGTLQGHRLSWACVFFPFPGPSSSGNQVLGTCTVPGGPCVLVISLVLATRFPGCAVTAPSQVCLVSPLGS